MVTVIRYRSLGFDCVILCAMILLHTLQEFSIAIVRNHLECQIIRSHSTVWREVQNLIGEVQSLKPFRL